MSRNLAPSLAALVLLLLAPSLGAEEKPLASFGYDIFREAKEPVVEGPVDENYILSPGDEIIISIWGQMNQRYPLTVSEDGFIEIPDGGGRVYTNGVSLKELRPMIVRNLSDIYATYINAANPDQSTAFVDVKFGKLRKLLVYIVGEVRNQGAYTIRSGVATLFNLLNNAGGIKETGTLRDVKIRRASGKIETVDLYDFLVSGRMETKAIQLRVGDYVQVPLKAKSVSVRGEVKRSGVYEIVGNEGLRDLVRFAGGLTSNAYLKRAQVRRYEINSGEKFIDLNLEEIFGANHPDFGLVDGDEVTVFPNVLVRRRLVEIQGAGVRRPGVFQFTPGMRLDDLVQKAEGLKEDVYLGRADFVRTNEDFTKTLSTLSLKDLYTEERPGHYTFTGPPGKNLVLQELDVVVTYSSFDMKGKDRQVTLEGRVKEPGTYVVADNTTLYDILFARGGFQDVAFRQRTLLDLAHIFRKRSGETTEIVIPFNLGRLLAGAPEENRILEPGDRIVVYAYAGTVQKTWVSVEGLVKKPGVFPFAEELTVEDLILAAGGLTPDAYKVEAVISRSTRGVPGYGAASGQADTSVKETSTIVPLSAEFMLLPKDKKTRLDVFDKVLVRNLPEWEPLPMVSVGGQVTYPGNYTLQTRDERIASVMKRAGGVKQDALPAGATLLRRKGIVALSLEAMDAYSQVAIQMTKALAKPGGTLDLVLKDGDRIFVPTNSGAVEVRGAVKAPTLLQFKDGEGLDYYVRLCGGYRADADRAETIVHLPNRTTVGMKKFLFFRRSPDVLAGSMIEVPVKERTETPEPPEKPASLDKAAPPAKAASPAVKAEGKP